MIKHVRATPRTAFWTRNEIYRIVRVGGRAMLPRTTSHAKLQDGAFQRGADRPWPRVRPDLWDLAVPSLLRPNFWIGGVDG